MLAWTERDRADEEEAHVATKAQKTFETRIEIPEDAREKLVELLNARLADITQVSRAVDKQLWFVEAHLEG